MFIDTEKAGYAGFLWDTLFSRKVIGTNRFDEGLKWLEDHLFSFEVFSHCKRMSLLPDVTYHYMADQSNSLSNVKDAWMVYNAGNKEYEIKSKLVGNSDVARRLNQNSYLGKIAYALEVLYKNYPCSERKRFHSETKLLIETNITDKQSKIFYSNIPILLSDKIILLYRFLRSAKRKIRKFLKKILIWLKIKQE